MNTQVVVIGAGLAGLCAAYQLKKQGISTLVFEASKSIGGKIQTRQVQGFTFDVGPNTVLESNEAVGRLLTDLGLKERMLWANAAANTRYILKEGKLVPLKASPALIFTPLLSLSAKLRLLKEPFIAPSPTRETAAEFIARRFGPEVLDYLIDPFLAGTFGARPEHLAADAAFKTLTVWEKKYGSVIKGAWQARKAKAQASKKNSRKMFSFAGGFYDVVKRLAEEIDTGLWCEVHVQSITRESDGLKISLTQGGVSKKIEAKKIIVATPAPQAAQLLESLATELAAVLKMIPYSPIAQVFLGYDTHRIKLPNGFGFLVPEREQRKILGIVFNSMIFPERYAEGAVMTVFIGGSRQPELAHLSEAELFALARAQIKEILGIDTAPRATAVVQWHQAIPQYNLHHQDVISSVEQYEQVHSDIFFTGNWRAGISVPDTIEHAEKVALQVAESLRYQLSAREFSH